MNLSSFHSWNKFIFSVPIRELVLWCINAINVLYRTALTVTNIERVPNWLSDSSSGIDFTVAIFRWWGNCILSGYWKSLVKQSMVMDLPSLLISLCFCSGFSFIYMFFFDRLHLSSGKWDRGHDAALCPQISQGNHYCFLLLERCLTEVRCWQMWVVHGSHHVRQRKTTGV